MAVLTPLHIALILIAVATYILYIKWVRSKYPPGPWPLPIIGNLHLLSQKPYKEFMEMTKIYGPVVTIWVGWQPTVVLSGPHSMKEAAGQKGFDFSGRDMDTIGYRIIFNDNEDIASRSYDDKVNTMRKLTLSIMKSKTIGGFSIQKVVEEGTQTLIGILKGLNGKLVDPSPLINLPVSHTIVRTMFNLRFKDEHDPELLVWNEAIRGLLSALEGGMPILLAPSLAYAIPSIPKQMRLGMQPLDDFIDYHVQHHEKTYQEGTIRDLTDLAIQYQRRQTHDTSIAQNRTRRNVCGLMKDILSGGTQTTRSTILWSFLVLLHRRDIQRKIHSELDNYLEKRKVDLFKEGSGQQQYENCLLLQLPVTVSDKSNLPYLNAFIYETLRLFPAAPLALPHRTTTDTSIGKNSIPKNTTVVFNLYGCNRDESIWENPIDFNPDRFLDANGQLNNSKVKQLMTFSSGPRSCLGENLAKIEIFVCLANVLHSFEVCCPSLEELPVLSDGQFRMELAPFPFKMMFNLR